MKTKRRFFTASLALIWMTIIGSFVSMIGIVIVATELFKFQRNSSNGNTIGGSLMISIGIAMNFSALGYQALTQEEATSAPVSICSNCINFLLGICLLIVAYVLPLSVMFGFLIHTRTTSSNGKVVFDVMPKRSSWDDDPTFADLEHSVQSRVTSFAVILIVLGAVGIFISSAIILRFHLTKQKEKKAQAARRKASQPNHAASKFESSTWKAIELAKRGSVYDYTAWDTRSKDLFSDKPMSEIEEEETQAGSVNYDGTFNRDLISESRHSSNFTFTHPFEKATSLNKGARRHTDTQLSSSGTARPNILKPKESIELRSLSAKSDSERTEMVNLSPTNLTTMFRRATSQIENETCSL